MSNIKVDSLDNFFIKDKERFKRAVLNTKIKTFQLDMTVEDFNTFTKFYSKFQEGVKNEISKLRSENKQIYDIEIYLENTYLLKDSLGSLVSKIIYIE